MQEELNIDTDLMTQTHTLINKLLKAHAGVPVVTSNKAFMFM